MERKANSWKKICLLSILVIALIGSIVGSTFAESDPTTYVLKRGDRNADVEELQLKLIELGFLTGDADGIFGQGTENALIEYQKSVGLNPTGECDFETYLSLISTDDSSLIPQETEKPVVKYIANKNTKKFHYANCSSVDDMKEKNKKPYYTREEAVAAGYVPCKRCHP